MSERICTIDGCGKTHRARGFCGSHYAKWYKHGDPLAVKVWGSLPGPAHPSWKPDACYTAVHDRLKRSRGKASEHSCACGARATEWAYDHADPAEIVGRSGVGTSAAYSTDLAHYVPMCKPCHGRLDIAHAATRRSTTEV